MSLITKFDKSSTTYLKGAREHLEKSLNQAAKAAYSNIEAAQNAASAGLTLVATAVAAGFTESVNAISDATVSAVQTVNEASHYFLPANRAYQEKMSVVELNHMKPAPAALKEIVAEVPEVRASASAAA